MTRFIAIFLTLVAGTVRAFQFVNVQGENETLVDLSDAALQDKKVGELVVTYYTFKSALEANINDLTVGTITLRDARDNVAAAARRLHPGYFTHIGLSEEGTTDEERIARNLVGHVRSNEEVTPNPNSRLPLIEKELRALLAENAVKK
jgi:hypothetical protein